MIYIKFLYNHSHDHSHSHSHNLIQNIIPNQQSSYWIKLTLTILLLLFLILFAGCDNKSGDVPVGKTVAGKSQKDTDKILFQLVINKDSYYHSLFGEPPQIAVWLENDSTKNFIPVAVTYRSAYDDWEGKVICPAALPYWNYRKDFYSKKNIEFNIDAYSSATPKNDTLSVNLTHTIENKWNYFIEANISADYNEYFSKYTADGVPDTEANGQPSLIWKGKIDFDKQTYERPNLIGRTEQIYFQDSLSKDLSGITSAEEIINSFNISFN